MSDEERSQEESEEGQGPRRPRVVDKRRSARVAAGEAPRERAQEPPPAEPAVPPAANPPPPQQAAPQEQPREATGAPPGEVWTPEQEAEARRMAEEITRTPSLDWVVQTAVTLANVAGTKLQMGVVADAQLAIDVLAGVIDAAGTRLEDAEVPLRQTLAQLQMMYAEAVAPPPPTA